MDREQARATAEALLERLAAGPEPLDLVEEAYLFGSFAQGAEEVRDLDLALEVDLEDPRLVALAAEDPALDTLRAALGAGEGVSIAFSQAASYQAEGFYLIRVWRRGESVTEALAALDRLEAEPLPAQGRDYLHPAFADLSLPRPDRRLLAGLAEREVITISGADAVAPVAPGPSLAAVRALNEQEAVRWPAQGPQILVGRGPRFPALEEALEELGFLWHYLLADDQPDEDEGSGESPAFA